MGEHFYRWQGKDLMLKIKVQPRSSKNEIYGELGNKLKIRLTVPPVDGKANQQLINFLAKIFKLSKSSATLISGKTGREKRILIKSPRQLPNIIPAT